MKAEVPKEKVILFEQIARSLGAAIKNSSLYPVGHPTLELSINGLKSYLDKWLSGWGILRMGISQDNILLDGKVVKEDASIFRELAAELHKKGVLAISIDKGVELAELVEFFKAMKAGAKKMPSTSHMKIKEVDYSGLLGSARDGVADEGKDIWGSLTAMGDEMKQGKLPEAKAEFLKEFLKDSKASASVLNRIYKEALAKVDEKAAVDNMRKVISNITKYMGKGQSKDAGKSRKDLTEMILNLDLDLVGRLFEPQAADGGNIDLSKDLLKDFTDDMVADFIVSLIGKEGGMNENLLKLFDRFVPAKGSSDNLATLVADKLFQSDSLGASAISAVQLSIKEMLKSHPDNDFMSQVYKLTVDSFSSGDKGPGALSGKYAGIVAEYRDFLEEDNLKREKIRLIINIVWYEKDPDHFKKFSDILVEAFKESIAPKFTRSLREILELYRERIWPEQKANPKIDAEIKNALEGMTGVDNLEKITGLIQWAGEEDLDDIVYILLSSVDRSAKAVLDSYVTEESAARREKLSRLLCRMGERVSSRIKERLEAASASNVVIAKELLRILKEINPDQAHTVSMAMLGHHSQALRGEAMEGFQPRSTEEIEGIFDLFSKERDPELKEKIFSIFLRTKNESVINRLFRMLGRSSRDKEFLLRLVKLSGDLKAKEAVPHISAILKKRPFFNPASANDLRVASVVSLAQIGTKEAITLLENATKDRSEPVRRMSKIMLELGRSRGPGGTG